jgi:hypothetical protein
MLHFNEHSARKYWIIQYYILLYGYLKTVHETFTHSGISSEGVINKYEQKAA